MAATIWNACSYVLSPVGGVTKGDWYPGAPMPIRRVPGDSYRIAVFLLVPDSVFDETLSGQLRVETAPTSSGPWTGRGTIGIGGATDGDPLQPAAPLEGEFPADVLTSIWIDQKDSQGVYVQVGPDTQYVRATFCINAGNNGANSCPGWLVLASQRLSDSGDTLVPSAEDWPAPGS